MCMEMAAAGDTTPGPSNDPVGMPRLARNRVTGSFGMKILLVAALAAVSLGAAAQNGANQPWEEYGKQITSRTSVKSLSSDLFGDTIDLQTGRLSFRQVDIDLPGSSKSLPVTLARTLSVADPIAAALDAIISYPVRGDLAFADWELDVPRISTVYAHHLEGIVLGPNGLVPDPIRDFAWTGQRCSGQRVPPSVGAFFPGDYWQGIHASMPGGGELLQPASGVQSPTSGGPYRWVTAGFSWFSCLSSIKNGTGEGFLAITADGTKYWFDWMANYDETSLRTSFEYGIDSPPISFSTVYEQELERKRNVLYATRVEDRYGNSVVYEYSNAAAEPARLNRIVASDGRQITLTYGTDGKVASASDGIGTWTYQYTQYVGGPQALGKVILPDNSQWSFDLGDQLMEIVLDLENPASCSYPGAPIDFMKINTQSPRGHSDAVVAMTHPSGAVGQFSLSPRLHGRSNVPKQCVAVPLDSGQGKPENGAYSDYVRMYWTTSVVQKVISGPGLATLQWTYQYDNAQAAGDAKSGFATGYSAPGSWAAAPYTWTRLADEGKPLTDISTYIIADPVCVSDTCAGSTKTQVFGPDGEWTRYTFGNSYRYNEGRLLKMELGSGPSAIARIEDRGYQFALTGQPFPTPIGFTRQYKGDTITNATLRPSRSMKITQDGRAFTSTVNGFDAFGRPVSITKSSAPSP